MAAGQPLLAPVAASWLVYVALGLLQQSTAFRVYSAGLLPSMPFTKDTAYALAPDALLTASRGGMAAGWATLIFTVLACLALASWWWALRIAREPAVRSLGSVLVFTTILSLPLLLSPGLFSDDVYLYNAYGRAIDVHGANPIEVSPGQFPADAHISWVHWKDLASAYGPLWLMLSAALSAIAGDSITAVVVVYRLAGLFMHLATAAAVWMVLRRARPSGAAAGTIFYAWNPLVLIEVVGNAHNDVLVALFAVLLVAAATQRAWSSAAFFAACAIMVKPFAALLVPPLAWHMVHTLRGGSRLRHFAAAGAAGVVTLAALSAPLWAGTSLLFNVFGNPATKLYTNTVWELLSGFGASWFGITRTAIQHPYLDVARIACFGVGAVWVLSGPRSRRSVPAAALSLWILFVVTASWAWPWYFVPAIAFAALVGSGGFALGAALTAGGLLFWATWPAPAALDALHTWRSVVLFGPVLLTSAAPVRAWILAALGERRQAYSGEERRLQVRLQTAAG